MTRTAPFRSIGPSVLAAALAACVPAAPPPEAPPPPPPPAPTPAPAPTTAWEDWPRTPGTWRYEQDARGSRALFGVPGQDALAVLRCDRGERRLFLSRPGAATTPLTVRTTARTQTLPVRPTGGTPPHVAVAFTVADPLLDAMAFSRGRVALEQAGTPALVMPNHAEIGRVIEDCRG